MKLLLTSLIILCAVQAQGQSLKKISKWNNQKEIDTGKSGLQVGYNCRVLNSTYHGMNIGYATRSGFEMGINTYTYYERLETLKNIQFTEMYFRYKAFNLWKGGHLNFQLTWRDSKYMPDNQDKRIEMFSCSTGISHSIKSLKIEFFGLGTMQGHEFGGTIGIGKRF